MNSRLDERSRNPVLADTTENPAVSQLLKVSGIAKGFSTTWNSRIPQIKDVKMIQVKKQNGQDVASGRIEAALRQHWDASAAGNQDIEHEIYDEHVICDYPQSGERIHGKQNLQNLRSHHPEHPTDFSIRRLQGTGNLWITEYMITYEGRPFYTISIMEFENGKVVHETQYFAEPFDPPGWRAQWVEQTGRRKG